jgi:CheY-like chemotaxis protein
MFSIYLEQNTLLPLRLFGQFLNRIKKFSSEVSIQQAISNNNSSSLACNIMIVDDDPDDQELLAEAISEVAPQVNVTFAMNGKDLLVKLQDAAEIPDLIIIDLNMPGINGFECLVAIKGNPLIKDIPILIYSTSANPEQIDFTHQNGASGYIQKPSSYFAIKKIASKILSVPIIEFFEKKSRDEFILGPD